MATDAKKAKVYTKYARLIEIAVREGGADITSNIRLRALIDAAKTESVPNANIERAIQKGSGTLKGEIMEEIIYEAYGPQGVALILECLTDNKNRTLGNIKLILSKNGGRLAEKGSVLWMFDQTGVVIAKAGNDTSKTMLKDTTKQEELELALIDYGAEDFQQTDEMIKVQSDKGGWQKISDFLRTKKFEIETAELQFIPKQTVSLSNEMKIKIDELISALEEDDDVSTVYDNAVMT